MPGRAVAVHDTPGTYSEGSGVNGYNFTERVRKILAIAREEAVRLDHDYVGTEHILLGLLAEGEGVAAAVLQNLDADPDIMRATVEQTVKPGRRSASSGPDVPYTSRGKKVLELAMAEATELRHQYVGTEHLLLGLLREEKGIAAQVLVDAGVTLQAARTETLRLLGNALAQPRAARGSNVVVTPAPRAARPLGMREHDQAREHAVWIRLTHALDVCERLGTRPSLTLEADGTLTVPLGPDLVVSVELPSAVRLRRRDAGPPPPPAGGSAQEPA